MWPDNQSGVAFTSYFLSVTQTILEQIDIHDVESVVSALVKCRNSGGRLFFGGSGGGAGHASHASCDFRKLGGFEAYCVSDNSSEITARTNDEGWETSYSAWLKASRFSARDCLFIFSVGGGSITPPVSMNLVNAMTYAKDCGGSVVGIVGRDGGSVRQIADASVLVPTVDRDLVTPQAEGLQAILWHLIVSHPDICTATAKWEGISEGDSGKQET